MSASRPGEGPPPGGAIDSTASVHPTAIVETGAVVGPGTLIWHFCHVLGGARVGARCVLGQGVFVGNGVVVGDGSRVQNQVSLYDGVVLEEEVFIGPSAVFTNVTRPRAFLSQRNAFQPTRVGRGATVGANATVVCGHVVGAYALVGAGAVVTRDVPAHALMVGVPARQVGWVCRCGQTLRAPADEVPARVSCEACGWEGDLGQT